MHERSYKRKSKLPPPLCDVDPIFRERFAAFGDADEIRVYRWLETQELEVRLSTRLAFPKAIELWQRSVRLRINNMLPGAEIDLPRGAPRDVDFWTRRYSKKLRLHLLALSISTKKSVVDLIMGGHYTEAFALERTAAERWKNCLYARIRPEDVFRWMPDQWLDPYPELDGIPRNQCTKPTGDDWGVVASRVANLPDEALLKLTNTLMKQLNSHVHPTMEGVSQIFIDLDRWHPAVGPQFSQLHAQLALRNLLILEE